MLNKLNKALFDHAALVIFLLVNILFYMASATSVRADLVDVGHGVRVAEPVGMTTIKRIAPPLSHAWQNPAGTISVETFAFPSSQLDPAGSLNEFHDWPSAGRSLAAGFGKSNIKVLGKQLNAECAFSGVPVAQDIQRFLMRVRVRVTCATQPQETVIQYELIQAITSAGVVLIRVSALTEDERVIEPAAESVWNSLQIDPAIALPSAPQHSNVVERVGPVAGGRGVRFVDYGLLNTPYLVGTFFGGLLGASLFGGLLSLVIIRVGGRPTASLASAQLALFAFSTWASAEHGVWEIDWLCRGVPAIIAFFLLRGYVRGKWEQRQKEAQLR